MTMFADVAAARLGSVQVTEVVVVQVQPAGARDRNESGVGGNCFGETDRGSRGWTIVGHRLRISDVVAGKHIDRRAASAQCQIGLRCLATISVAVAELAPNAWFAALTLAVSVMIVPLAVPPSPCRRR